MIVPVIFMIISLIGFYFSGLSGSFIFNEMVFRLSRNLILVMSLIVPVITGMGLNFGIVIGAMAGQIGLIFILNYGIGGMAGIIAAILVSTPIALFFGYLVAKVLNKAKGREMITSMILGFFANGLYQFVFILLIGTVIPLRNKKILMTTGKGLRNVMDLISIRKSLDNFVFGGMTQYPIMTFVFIILLFTGLYFLLKTKLGQNMRAVGQNMHIASISGIDVDKTRIIAMLISTVLAAWGQIVYLQNIGNFSTYSNHEQVGLFAVASLLIGGATVDKASWKEALMGTFLFHLLFIVSPQAGQNLMGDAQIGEYFRAFIAYGIIGIALLLHAWEKVKNLMKLSELEESDES